jgi:hypothetical protein
MLLEAKKEHFATCAEKIKEIKPTLIEKLGDLPRIKYYE